MTKQELLDMAEKLRQQAESMGDETSDSPESTNDGNTEPSDEPIPQEDEVPSELESETPADIDPEPNGAKEEPPTESEPPSEENLSEGTEVIGTEQVATANIDERFATALEQYNALKQEVDKIKVALSEIMTRIDLVQEVTDKVSTVNGIYKVVGVI